MTWARRIDETCRAKIVRLVSFGRREGGGGQGGESSVDFFSCFFASVD